MFVKRLDYIDAEHVARRWRRFEGFFWLDANGLGGDTPRWTYLGHSPVERRSGELGVNAFGALDGLDSHRDAGPLAHAPRWVGFVPYDAFWESWTRTTSRHPRSRTARAFFARYAAVLAISPEREAYAVGDDEHAVAGLLGGLNAEFEPASRAPFAFVPGTVTPRATHERAIEAALEHVRAGDIYQVNLARRWTGRLEGEALELFCRMRDASEVPLGFFFDAGSTTIAARTMETYLDVERDETTRVRGRPIKGTIARAGDDAGEAKALVADPKEHAEHVMIVDLIRNDLGRVATLGSVRVRKLLEVEPYARLSHLVSTVECEVASDVSLRRIVQETFPPGSVTGTPKIRAMEVIDALESFSRGVYCGAVGMVRRDGGALFAVAIRTATITGNDVEYFAGGGLVAASIAAKEVAETELKARVFFDACGVSASDFSERDD